MDIKSLNRNNQLGKINYFKIIFLIILLGSTRIIKAQEQFSLNDLVTMALNENYDIRIMQNEEAITTNNNTYGMAGFLPSIGITGEIATSYNNTFTRLYSGDTRVGDNARNNALNAYAEINWVIFDGLSMFARKNQLELLEQMGALQTRYYIEQTITDLAKAYYQLVLQRQLLRNYQESFEISSFRRNLEQRRLQIGSGTGLQSRQAIVDYNNDSAILINQKAVIKSLELQLNKLINRPLESPLIPSTEQITLDDLENKADLLNHALQNNQQVQNAYLAELLAEAMYREERGNRFPEVSLFGNYAYSRQTSEVGISELNRSYGPQVGIRVRFNLFNGNQQNIQIRNSRIQSQIAGIRKENVTQEVEALLLDAFNQHEALQDQVQLMRENLSTATEAMNIARQQLAAGAINGYDFRMTQLTLLEIQNNISNLLFEQNSREIDIQRIIGALNYL